MPNDKCLMANVEWQNANWSNAKCQTFMVDVKMLDANQQFSVSHCQMTKLRIIKMTNDSLMTKMPNDKNDKWQPNVQNAEWQLD